MMHYRQKYNIEQTEPTGYGRIILALTASILSASANDSQFMRFALIEDIGHLVYLKGKLSCGFG